MKLLSAVITCLCLWTLPSSALTPGIIDVIDKLDPNFVVLLKSESDTILDQLSHFLLDWTHVKFVSGFNCSQDGGSDVLVMDLDPVSTYLSITTSSSSFGDCSWIFIRSWENKMMLNRLKPDFQSRVYLLDQTQSGLITNLHEVYSIYPGELPRTALVSKSWNGSRLFDTPNLWDRRKNLSGIRVRIGMFYVPPVLFMSNDQPPKPVGYNIDIIDTLAEELNFTYDFVTPEVNSFGTMDPDGNWNGLMKDLISGTIDLTLILQVTEERNKFVDYSHVILHSDLVLVSKKPDLSINLRLLNLFTSQVWIVTFCFVTSFMLLAIIIVLANQGIGFDVTTLILSMYGNLINQTSPETLTRTSMRILTFVMLVFGFLGQNFFNANLTSSISVKVPSLEINGLDDVMDLGYDLFITSGTTVEQEFKSAQSGIRKRLWESKISRDPKFRPLTFADTLDNFAQYEGDAAVLIYETAFHQWARHNTDQACTMNMKSLINGDNIFAMAFRKGFPFYQVFNHVLGKMRESGLLNNLQKKWINSKEMSQDYLCSSAWSSEDIAMSMANTKFFYVILLFGIVASVFTLSVETCLSLKSRK